MWMYDPAQKIWLGRMTGHQIYVEESSCYPEGGEGNTSGGCHRWSKRYKELTLEGPSKAEKLLIKVEARCSLTPTATTGQPGALRILRQLNVGNYVRQIRNSNVNY